MQPQDPAILSADAAVEARITGRSAASFSIGPHPIVQGGLPLVVAEIGVNHDGVPARAYELVSAAAAAGAGAVKLQVFDPARLVTAAAATAGYQRAAGEGDRQRAMLERLVLPHETLVGLVVEARRLGLTVLATPFDPDSLALVDRLGVDGIKIGSGDLTNTPLLAAAAATGRPLICSTGMADGDEVSTAVATITAARPTAAGDPDLAILHCVSAYPAPPDAANLRAIPALHASTGLPVGWSDHVPGTTAAIAAVALGAPILERHLTLDRTSPGPDHAASDDPVAFSAYVEAVRTAHMALGDGRKRPSPIEADVREAARRSLVAGQPIPKGCLIEPSMLDLRRPGTGLPPSALEAVVGRIARRDIPADTLITEDMVA